MALDMELAEYFKERSHIEETYAKSLEKASKRLYMMDPGVLGFVKKKRRLTCWCILVFNMLIW